MSSSRRLLAAAVVAAGLVLGLPGSPAVAGPEASGRIGVRVTDVESVRTERNFCGTGQPVRIHEVLRGRQFYALQGRDSLPYLKITFHVRITITERDGTTVTLTSHTVTKDQRIVDNGDGTFTVTVLGAGGYRVTGPAGSVRDPGRVVFQLRVRNNGTPQDPSDDSDVDGSFRIVRESTGLNESAGLCADYLAVTGQGG